MATITYTTKSDSRTLSGVSAANKVSAADMNEIKTSVNALYEAPFNAQTGTTYTLVLTDASKIVTMSNASANTLTVPPNSSVAFPLGTQILVIQKGAGTTTIAAGSGVTINSEGGALDLNAQYAGATLIKEGTDTWYLVGSIA